MKLTEWEREDYKALKKQLKPEFYLNKVSGLTIAVYHRKGQSFARMATAYCSKKDKYKEKRGKYTALARLAQMDSMLVPVERIQEVLDVLLPVRCFPLDLTDE